MSFYELLLVAVGLSMDAFAVAVGKGLSSRDCRFRDMLKVGIWFGVFQALMPLIGYFLGSSFRHYVEAVDHWIAFGLLLYIGVQMIIEGFKKEKDEENASRMDVKTMLILAVATSIDAFAVGISMAMVGAEDIFLKVGIIGCITLVLSMLGYFIGNRFGARFKSGATVVGGIILILIGLKILAEHLGFWPF